MSHKRTFWAPRKGTQKPLLQLGRQLNACGGQILWFAKWKNHWSAGYSFGDFFAIKKGSKKVVQFFDPFSTSGLIGTPQLFINFLQKRVSQIYRFWENWFFENRASLQPIILGCQKADFSKSTPPCKNGIFGGFWDPFWASFLGVLSGNLQNRHFFLWGFCRNPKKGDTPRKIAKIRGKFSQNGLLAKGRRKWPLAQTVIL